MFRRVTFLYVLPRLSDVFHLGEGDPFGVSMKTPAVYYGIIVEL